MADPSPFGETSFRAILRAISDADPVKVRGGGWVESVLTLRTQRRCVSFLAMRDPQNLVCSRAVSFACKFGALKQNEARPLTAWASGCMSDAWTRVPRPVLQEGMVIKVFQFVTLLLFSLVTGVFWGTWFSLSRSMAAITPGTFLEVGHLMILNLGGPMSVLMPTALASALVLCVLLYRDQQPQATLFAGVALVM